MTTNNELDYNEQLRLAIQERADLWPGWTVTWESTGCGYLDDNAQLTKEAS